MVPIASINIVILGYFGCCWQPSWTQHFGADLAPAPLAVALAPYCPGSVAVLLFFALSGFVITEAVDSVYRNRPGPFLTNRLLRIVPHFLLAVALAMLAHKFFRIAGGVRLWRSQPSFPDNAFELSNVLPNFLAIAPMGKRFIDYNFLTITWAIRVEMALYLRRLPWPRGFALVASGLLVLLLPLSWLIMAALAFAPIARGRNIDRALGDLTYPLYLYREVVLIVILTVTTGYAYSTLAVGFVVSFVAAAVLMASVDPAVTLYRERVRGRALRQVEVNVGSGAEPLRWAIVLRPVRR